MAFLTENKRGGKHCTVYPLQSAFYGENTKVIVILCQIIQYTANFCDVQLYVSKTGVGFICIKTKMLEVYLASIQLLKLFHHTLIHLLAFICALLI